MSQSRAAFNISIAMTAKAHDMWAGVHADLAKGYRRVASRYTPSSGAEASFLWLAARLSGAALGLRFRANELRADARERLRQRSAGGSR
jgi:hypothetical protein